LAEVWIKQHGLTGTLTQCPINEGVWDWAVRSQMFTPKKEEQKAAWFIENFSSASQEHFHYEDGSLA
jgi:hypothetical protein